MQLTSSPRRALGLLAAGTVGLSTALLGVTGVAQAAPTDPPNAPVIEAVEGADGALHVYFEPNHPADEDLVTAGSDSWQYELDGDATWVTASPIDFDSGFAHFEIDGLTNGDEYSIKVRGVDDDLGAGAPSAAATGTPFLPIGAPGDPVVQVGSGTMTVSWTAPTVPGTFPLDGYVVSAAVSAGESGGYEDLCETDPATLTCTAPVIPGYTYTIFVAAFDTAGNLGSESNPSASTGPIPAVAVPGTVPTKNGDLTLPAGAGSSVVAGKTMTVSGTGYAPGSTVTLAIYSTPQVLTTVVADSAGNFTVTVTVPAGLAAGSHTLVAAGVDALGNPRYVNLPITVTAAGVATVATASAGKPSLAATGADVTVPALAGGAALALGAGLIVASRRRSAA